MNTLPGILTVSLGIGAAFTLFGYWYGKFRSGSSKASIESNQILRGLLDDQKQEILKLRERAHDTENKVQGLVLKIQILEDRRNYLENLVQTALLTYFKHDSQAAAAAGVAIATTSKRGA